MINCIIGELYLWRLVLQHISRPTDFLSWITHSHSKCWLQDYIIEYVSATKMQFLFSWSFRELHRDVITCICWTNKMICACICSCSTNKIICLCICIRIGGRRWGWFISVVMLNRTNVVVFWPNIHWPCNCCALIPNVSSLPSIFFFLPFVGIPRSSLTTFTSC